MMRQTTTDEPRPYRWSRDEYFKMSELGWFDGRRVELIGGEVIEMPAQFDVHLAAITLTQAALGLAFGPAYWVRNQGTLDLSPHGVPDPDLAVIRGSPKGRTGHTIPTSALLVVEVSESSLRYDRREKGSMYAAAGIADYWIVNLVQKQLEIYRRPVADSAETFGFRYSTRKILDPGDAVAPLAARKARVAVADLFP
jgi:Uma2 family endonuclease